VLADRREGSAKIIAGVQVHQRVGGDDDGVELPAEHEVAHIELHKICRHTALRRGSAGPHQHGFGQISAGHQCGTGCQRNRKAA